MATVRLLPPLGTPAFLAVDDPASATFNTILEARQSVPFGESITLAMVTGGLWVPNAGTLTMVSNAVADETVTINTTVYTWATTPTTTAFTVLIGANAAASVTNLIKAINLSGISGTTYGSATTVHPQVRAYAGAGTSIVVLTKTDTILTAVGTLYPTTTTMADATWGATTLADGTNGTNIVISVVGTNITATFSSAYTTVSDFEAALAAHPQANNLVRVKTAGTTPLYQIASGTDAFTAYPLNGYSTTGTNGTPSGPTAGKALPHTTDRALVFAKSIIGSGTMTCTLKLWGWNDDLNDWFPLGTNATAASKGLMNEGNAIPEGPISDRILHVEEVSGLRKFSRIYCEVTSIGGTGTGICVYLACIPASAVTEG